MTVQIDLSDLRDTTLIFSGKLGDLGNLLGAYGRYPDNDNSGIIWYSNSGTCGVVDSISEAREKIETNAIQNNQKLDATIRDQQQRYDAQSAEYKLARQRLIALADETIVNERTIERLRAQQDLLERTINDMSRRAVARIGELLVASAPPLPPANVGDPPPMEPSAWERIEKHIIGFAVGDFIRADTTAVELVNDAYRDGYAARAANVGGQPEAGGTDRFAKALIRIALMNGRSTEKSAIAAEALNWSSVDAGSDEPCCADCGRLYGNEHGFPDLVIPNEAWAKITHGGGLLCPSCMCARAYSAGLVDVPAVFRSGPFCTSIPSAPHAAAEDAGAGGDPLDTPLPCTVVVGHIRFSAGVKLRTLVDAAARWLKAAQADGALKEITVSDSLLKALEPESASEGITPGSATSGTLMAADPRTIDELVEIFRRKLPDKTLQEIADELRSVNDYGNISVRETINSIRAKLKS